MVRKKVVNIPMNRVEGDLEIRVEVDDGLVADAWCSGTMYRGFERLLVGRGALDGLVITPRVCGICSTAHLTAASRALDKIANVAVPGNAIRMRNLALMVEMCQSDMRHSFLMFAVDFANPAYNDNALYAEAVRRYTPLQGSTMVQVVQETKRLLEIVAIIGGQWPHSSYMVPGGIVSVPSSHDLLQCQLLLTRFRRWYETSIIGCSLERIAELHTMADLEVWLEESEAHRDSELGFFVRFARSIGLQTIGKGTGNFISYGGFDCPEGTDVKGTAGQMRVIPSGFVQGSEVDGLDQTKIAEHVAYSWFKDYTGGRHPANGKTRPYATGQEGTKYSWAKAPRYDGLPSETGPLAQAMVAREPLFTALVRQEGASVFARELARLLRPVRLLPAMAMWIREATEGGRFYSPPGELLEGEGYGISEVTRGALGHWVSLRNGAIEHYQIVTPTAWNASPRDSNDVRGPLEEALIGGPVPDVDNPIALGHIARSFDLCLVCTVHAVANDRQQRMTLDFTW